MKIRVDRDVCVGAGMCALSAPGVFAQARDDGRVLLIDDGPAAQDAQAAARKASYLCPSGAITIEPESPGERIASVGGNHHDGAGSPGEIV